MGCRMGRGGGRGVGVGGCGGEGGVEGGHMLKSVTAIVTCR